MNTQTTTYVIVGAAAAISLVAFTALILVPVWSAYGRVWEKFAATLLSLFILATLVGVGFGIGAAVFWFWPDVFGLVRH